MAAAYLQQYSAEGETLTRQLFPHQQSQLGLLQQMIDKKINSPLTSSCGRLFDAVAAILGLRKVVSYEGQAAIILEATGERPKAKDMPGIGELLIKKTDGGYVLSAEEIIPKIARYRLENKSVELLSKSFHHRLSDGLIKITVQAARDTGLKNIALSGGCFQNMTLLNSLVEGLNGMGFKVYINSQVPANDGGIALGQAYWGMHNS